MGPDNAIWYAVFVTAVTDLTHLTGHIVRQPISGQVQEFAAPHGPNSIASGSDGALWFSEYSEFVTGGDRTIAPVSQQGVIDTSPPLALCQTPDRSNLALISWPPDRMAHLGFTVGQMRQESLGASPSGGVKIFTTEQTRTESRGRPGALWLLDARNNLWHYRCQDDDEVLARSMRVAGQAKAG